MSTRLCNGFAVALLILSVSPAVFTQSVVTPKRWAVVNGEDITEDQVKQSAGKDLENLDLRKLQVEKGLERDRQSIYEHALNSIVEKRLIAAEAKKRGLTDDALLNAEVETKVTYPSDKEVTDFYEANKARIQISGDEALRQIRAYLRQQRRDTVYNVFIEKLRKDYGAQTYLEPLRTNVATDGFPTKGPATARVTIVEFSDFECPYCGALFPTLKKIEANYGDRIRLVFRQFPLTGLHPHAQKAAEASLCANEQQKFWELHDAMFQDNKNLGVDALKQKASDLKLDMTSFNGCLDTAKYSEQITEDIHEGVRAGVTGTPAMFVNGRFLNGAQPYEAITKIIDEELQRTSNKN